MAIATLVACDDGDGWNPEAQFAPPLRPAFGARVTDNQLRLWTGSPCTGVTRLALTFNPDQSDRADLVLSSSAADGAQVEHLTIGGPYPGLEVSESLPPDFDWRAANSLRLVITANQDGWGSSTDLATVEQESAQHATDTFWFQDIGWLNPTEVAEQDGTTFLATCTSAKP